MIKQAIVLAAGEGTRMKSQTPKVLHVISGRSLLGHVLNALESVEPANIRVVVGAGREQVEAHLSEIAPDAIAIFQAERNGTGHAVQIALDGVNEQGNVLILAGDTPILSGQTLKDFLTAHMEGGYTASVLTAGHPDPTGYGRIIRDDENLLLKIVEEKDANDNEKLTFEVNSGVYIFDFVALTEAILQLKNNNAQGELYLTDAIEIIRKNGGKVAPILCEDFTETLGVNDRVQLAEAAAILRDRVNERHMRNGVTILDPATTWIDDTVTIAADVTILPGSAIYGSTAIASHAVIGPRTTLQDCAVNCCATIKESNCTASEIGENANVGPFAFLRAGTVLANESKAGAFVEIKNSQIGTGSKVPHLSYVGDATIGEGSNIGAATIFVNYDGVEKHRTEIGDHVRIGSDTMLVAPITVGDGAYTAAGSVITEDVPAGAIGVGRAKQRNVLGWVMRKRSGSKSAKAAEQATKNKGE
ncbi:MAG: bifunctional UDP-N-acetylglucosamine diphosphorylase/glucosamine-1-phosphate N-acetyltransferase GlmU [Candidatus Nanopelagicaceae bacterium]